MNNNLQDNLRLVLRKEARRIMAMDKSLYEKVQELNEVGNIMKLIDGYYKSKKQEER